MTKAYETKYFTDMVKAKQYAYDTTNDEEGYTVSRTAYSFIVKFEGEIVLICAMGLPPRNGRIAR